MNTTLLKELLDAKLSSYVIAKRMGCSRSTVRHWMKKGGHKLHRRRRTACECGRCGEKDPTKFYGKKKSICGKCHAKYTTERGREMKQKAVELLGGACSVCGYKKSLRALDFHHKDPTVKDPSFKSKRGWKWNRVVEELKKCVLVCRNCHAEIHEQIDNGRGV